MELRLRSLVAPLLLFVGGCMTAALGRVSVAATVCLVTSASLLVSLGFRHVRRQGISPTTILPAACGVLIFVSLFYLYLSQIRFFDSGIELAKPIDLETMNSNADSILSDPTTTAERKAFVSRMRARMVFVETGEITHVFDESGREALFQPSDDDHEQRTTQEQLRTIMPLGSASSRDALYLLGFAFAISTLLGLATPVRPAAG